MNISVEGMYRVILDYRLVRKIGVDIDRAALPSRFQEYLIGKVMHQVSLYKQHNINTDINDRWEKGVPHHPRSLELMKNLSAIDMAFGNDYFCWKTGGDGDSGEHMLYEMDIYFELQDKLNNK